MSNYVARNPAPSHYGYFFWRPPLERGYEKPSIMAFSRVRYRTSCIASKIRYIGNVYVTHQGDETTDKTKRYPDSVFKSDVGQYDTFRPHRRIDVAVGDGEDIIALAAFADRLLQFKQSTIYVINIQGDSEFLEDTFRYKGVKNDMAVITTDFGIAWVNDEGVFLYGGDGGVTNILERGGRRVITRSTDTLPAQVDGKAWDTFVNDQTAIGYSPADRKIFVKSNAGYGSAAVTAGDLYVFDIPSKSWTYHAYDSGGGRYDTTRFFIDHNQKLLMLEENSAGNTVDIRQFGSTPVATSNTAIWTKNFDFGDPYVRKTVYKVSVRSKYANSMKVFLSYDGGETKEQIGTLANGSTAEWNELVTNLPKKDIYQVMVGFNVDGGVAPSTGFELYEINITYRTKKVESL